MTPNDAQDATHSPEPAQDAPEVIRELQAAREAKWAEALSHHRVEAVMVGEHSFGWQCLTCEAEGWSWSGLEQAEQASLTHHVGNLMALAAEETFEATSALRQELAQAQAEVERLRDGIEGLAAWFESQPNWNGWGIHRQIRALAADTDLRELAERFADQSGTAKAAEAEIVAALAAEPTPNTSNHEGGK